MAGIIVLPMVSIGENLNRENMSSWILFNDKEKKRIKREKK